MHSHGANRGYCLQDRFNYGGQSNGMVLYGSNNHNFTACWTAAGFRDQGKEFTFLKKQLFIKKYLNDKKYNRYMENEEIERSLTTIKEFSEYVRKSGRAYGIAWAVFGLIILTGFAIMQLLLYRVEWYWIVFLGIFGTLILAFLATGLIIDRIQRKIGKARSWVDVNCGRIWRLAILGGVCLNIGISSIFVPGIPEIKEVSVTCYILLGWFVADGMGSSASGVLTGSKGMTITRIMLMVSVIPLALFALEYAFLAFGLIMGAGYIITGLTDHNAWLKGKR